MKTTILLVITLLGSAALYAEIPIELPMLKNAAVLKAYALTRAAGASMTVGSSGQVPNRGISVVVNKEVGDTADDLIAKLARTPVAFTLASARDQVNLNVEVYDETRTVLFRGSRGFTCEVGDDGRLQLPRSWGRGDFIVMQPIRIPFPGVQSVEVDFRDRNGKLLNNPGARVVADGFLFPADWTERAGEIKITYLDAQRQERTAVYDLQSASLRPVTALANWDSSFAALRIQNYWRVSDNSPNINLGGLPKDSVIRIDVTKTFTTNSVTVPLSVDLWFTFPGGEVPTAAIVAGQDERGLYFSRYKLNSLGQYFKLPFWPGKYFLFLESQEDQYRELTFEN